MVRLSVPFAECRLVEVTAHLQAGAALTGLFPAPLDGILATAERRRILGPVYGSEVDHHTVKLPLCRTPTSMGCGAQWVWAATAAQGAGTTDVHWMHGRFDDAPAERVVDRLPAATDVGRYKAHRKPVVVTVTSSLTWWCLGVPELVAELLAGVVSIGARTGAGEGYVLGWDVADRGEADWDPICWQDGRIARAFPARMAGWLGVAAPEVVAAQIRPPYWRAAHTPERGRFARSPREVIAPWTARPLCSTLV